MYNNVFVIAAFVLASNLSAMETKRVVAGATESKEQVKQLTEQEQQLLTAAAKGGKEGLEVIKTLVEKYGILDSYHPKGVNLNVQDNDGNTPLILAAQHEHSEIVAYLMRTGYAKPSVKNKTGRTALMFAASANTDNAANMVKELSRYAGVVNLRDNQKRTAHFYAVQKNNIDVIKLLYAAQRHDFRQLINRQDKDGLTVLMLAAEDGYADMVKFLLDNGANPELQDRLGLTALGRATKAGREDVIKLLNKKHAQKLGEELGEAIFHEDKVKIQALLKQGADVNVIVRGGWPLLAYIVYLRLYEFVPDFIKAGADLNAKDIQGGMTALIYAATQGEKDVVQQLLAAGADATLIVHRKTAADFAQKAGHKELANLLDEAAKKQLAAKSAGAAGEAKELG